MGQESSRTFQRSNCAACARFFALVIALLSSCASAGSDQELALNAMPKDASTNERALKIGVNIALPNLLSFHERQLTGYEAKKYSCVLSRIPYQYELLPLPIARLQVMLAKARIDVALMMSQTDERDKTAVIGSPITHATFQVVTKFDTLPEEKYLSNWRIGGLRGSSFLEFARVNLGQML